MPNLSRKVLIFLSFTLLIGSGFAAYTKFDNARKSALPPTDRLLTRARLDLLQYNDRELILEWECPEIQIERDPQTGRITGIDIPGATPYFHTGVPRLPELSQPLDCLPGRVDAQIMDVEAETRSLGEMAPTPEDEMIDPPGGDGHSGRALDGGNPPLSFEERRALTPLLQGVWPPENLLLNEAGIFRGHRLMSLQFFPVQVDARQGTVRIVRRARIRVTLPPADPAASRLPDRNGETEFLRRMLGPLAATAQTTRMTEAFEGRGEQNPRLDETIGGR
ncbi:hypothetical protein KKH27_05085, partial [bacterium]|nr:hypothetical protein [bacterium]MBU1984311.1 hypothetical protein [bacterium]